MLKRDDIEDMGYEYYTTPSSGNMQTPLEMVQEFSRIMQQLPNPALYAALIAEEADEWRSEYLHDTKADQLKELADLAYVVFGYANAKGWDLMEAIARVHKNNIGRCIQPDGSIQRRPDGKVMKNKDYPKVDLNDLV